MCISCLLSAHASSLIIRRGQYRYQYRYIIYLLHVPTRFACLFPSSLVRIPHSPLRVLPCTETDRNFLNAVCGGAFKCLSQHDSWLYTTHPPLYVNQVPLYIRWTNRVTRTSWLCWGTSPRLTSFAPSLMKPHELVEIELNQPRPYSVGIVFSQQQIHLSKTESDR